MTYLYSMTRKELFKIRIQLLKDNIRFMLNRLWYVHIRQWWYELWIRKDEFHQSLDMDFMVLAHMNEGERNKYAEAIVRRRNIAHEKSLGEVKCELNRFQPFCAVSPNCMTCNHNKAKSTVKA